ncbi:MAG: DUF6268 family outer membrane beta-barrel protein [Nibricoccus sp.]
MRTIFASILFLSLCACAFAQSELMPETGSLGLTVNARMTGSVNSKLKRDGTTYDQIDTSSAEIGLTQTIRLNKGNSLRLSLERQRTTIDQDLNADDPVVPLPDELNSLSAAVAYTHIASPAWIFTGRVGAGSHVTDTGLLSEGWAANAMAMTIYNRSKTLTYMFGLVYGSNMEDLRILPIFGLNWRPSPKWSIAVGFPKTGATYHFNKALSLGLGFSGGGGSYYVKTDPRSHPSASSQPLGDTWLQQRDIRLGFDANWKINQTVRISGAIGQVLYRKFKYVDRDFELKSDNFAPFVSVAGLISF